MAARFVFITGGVVSSLGKGIASSALGALLQERGFKVRLRKLDPYLNIDPGTMNPFQHGECYVTHDGAETDLDLGHYERFTGVKAQKSDNITTGQIYHNVIAKERRGDYNGGTVQVIPHVTDAIKEFIGKNDDGEDFILCEIGGTVGDIEGLPFLEAIRQFGNEMGRERVVYIHVTLLPWIEAAGELKTKPTQHSVKELLSVGIQPNILLCRVNRNIPDSERKKISLFCNVKESCVIAATDVSSIYDVPVNYHQKGLDSEVLSYFKMDDDKRARGSINLSRWDGISEIIHHPEGVVKVAIVGKYVQLPDAYKSLIEALTHGGVANHVKVEIKWVNSEDFDHDSPADLLENCHGVLVPGGFGERGTDGKINAIKYARENNIPFFGICFGMQMAVIEIARHLADIKTANSSEFGPCKEPLVGLLTEWVQGNQTIQRKDDEDLGGTMRLGAYPCQLQKGSLVRSLYGQDHIEERHRHRFEVNLSYKEKLEAAGLVFSGMSPDGQLPEIIELPDHKWFIGVQFHPELCSRPFAPHPLFAGFVAAMIKQTRLI